MKRLTYAALGIFVFTLFVPSRSVEAGEATEQLNATISSFVTILSSTPVAELQSKGLPENARQLVFARFDFSEMTKRSLGSHWSSLEPAEQREFVDAFTQRILVSYGRTVRSSVGDKIEFGREVREGQQASVETKVISGRGAELPIGYRLHDIDGQWKVYDVIIDQMSLVNNYRAQFERVIAKSSIKNLLQIMKEQGRTS